MIYSALITDIISRTDADFVSEYEDRAKALFLSVVAQLVGSGDYRLTDIPELISSEEIAIGGTTSGRITVLGASNEIAGDPNVIDIAEVYDDPDSADDGFVYVKKEIEYMKGISNNAQLAPDTNEIYYYWLGSDLVFYPKATADTKTPRIVYAKSPVQWSDSDEMVGKYSQPFLQRAADLTTEKLKTEVNN